MRRASCSTRPAMVIATSSGRRQSNSRLRSRIGTSPWHHQAAVLARDRRRATIDIVLVVDVADDLLDDVLERDDAPQRAVFVDHEGEMLVACAEGLELVEQRWSISGMNQGSVMTSSILTVGGRRRPRPRGTDPWRGGRRRCCRARRDRAGCACRAPPAPGRRCPRRASSASISTSCRDGS